ncbi:MAG: isoprenylcysteine carboxylmethyltransferase family protein [Lachnospiraceae bacterium]|nr:isoprenylcysteine carboxylmethyltransferase family protein [Lachnospiraceae bacterium]
METMIYQGIAIVLLFTFYTFYIAKLIIQKKQSIKTNQMGMGNKPKKVLVIERIMSIATVLVIVAEVASIFLVKHYLPLPVRITGLVLGASGVLFFAMATVTMKSSWRVGIPEEKTTLVTSGIYAWSRNPAFVGFDLLYFGICMVFFNIPLLIISLWAAVMLHLQILQEEAHMEKMCGAEYREYRARTMRYLGRKKAGGIL